ncbi:rbcL [Symbiodinium natans]|uniref:RbcL protein n=1 Tax=Symbiodinium natans TaxID=878477 RepID=A0A812JJE9_9DINO|nr:rbcL [Symbiodinium natans]
MAYNTKPKAGYDDLATAARPAAKTSTGTSASVCTADEATKSADALVSYANPACKETKIAYPNLLVDRNVTDGQNMMCSFQPLPIGNKQGMGDVECGKIYNFYEACYAFWQGGGIVKNNEPRRNLAFCQMNECILEVLKAMPTCVKETVQGKLFSASVTNEMIDRSTYILSQFGPLSEICALLVDGYVADKAVTCAQQFSCYRQTGHGSVTSPTQQGYATVIGASGIPTESSVQSPSFDWAKQAFAAAFVGASVAPQESGVAQSLDEEALIKKLVCNLPATRHASVVLGDSFEEGLHSPDALKASKKKRRKRRKQLMKQVRKQRSKTGVWC